MGARGTEPGEQRIRSAAPQPLGPSEIGVKHFKIVMSYDCTQGEVKHFKIM